MHDDNINNYIPSIVNPRAVRKHHDLSLTQDSKNSSKSVQPFKRKEVTQTRQNSIVSRRSLSLKRTNSLSTAKPSNVKPKNKENSPNVTNLIYETHKATNKDPTKTRNIADDNSLGFSAIEDLQTTQAPSVCDIDFSNKLEKEVIENDYVSVNKYDESLDSISVKSYKAVSSNTELEKVETGSVSTSIYSIDKPTIKVSFGVNDCESVHVNARNGTIKRFSISRNDISTNIDCEVQESTQISTESPETELDENMNETSASSLKRPAVDVSLEIKKQKMTVDDTTENLKVLILKSNAIEKISHVIVQPPNYKFVKRDISHKRKYKNGKSGVRNGNVNCARLKQATIESFFYKGTDAIKDVSKQLECVAYDVVEEMNRNSGVNDTAKYERVKTAKVKRKESNDQPKSARLPSKRDIASPRRQDTKAASDVPSVKNRNESLSAQGSKKNAESLHFNLPVNSMSNKTSLSPRSIPYHKIVAGTHIAVDAFSYGEIPNVKHYFLTHFHSDHYSGLKKSFSKLLFCSKITADLCISRLGVSPKNIRIINIDEVVRIDGVEVTPVDANHCPGAIMLVFTLPNGKTLLHTGDFRACPAMESLPVFWNKDIHTVYLDTTYCNPRYDFPTQDQSLEMALYLLRQKKMNLEKAGKKFSSVLIVCGTYTIGKEKFFLGMSRRIGCSVWACPEKERVLQIVEGGPCSHESPQACQLHVVPMRDLTHEKLRCYLDSLQGAFSEVVAFKPSGWENGKNSSVEKDYVTIHGIPYSEHSSFSELIRFVNFLKPKQVVPTVDISGGIKAVQKYFPCPLVYKEEIQCQTKLSDYFSIHNRQQVSAVT